MQTPRIIVWCWNILTGPTLTGFLVFLLILHPQAASAYGSSTRRHQRIVSPDGRFYLVIRQESDEPRRFHFWYAARRPGSPAVTPIDEYSRTNDWDHRTDRVKVRKGDAVLGEGSMSNSYGSFTFRSDGRGFLFVQDFPLTINDPNAVQIFAGDGSVQRQYSINELFPKPERSEFRRWMGKTFWIEGSWFDERRGLAVLIPRTGAGPFLTRTIRIADGILAEDGPEELILALDNPDTAAQSFALERLIKLNRLPELSVLQKIYHHTSNSPSVHLRAAIALVLLGDKRGAPLIARTARAPEIHGEWPADWALATEYLPETFGPSALGKIRLQGHSYHSTVAQALAKLGDPAIPKLLNLLDESCCYTEEIDPVMDALMMMDTGKSAQALFRLATVPGSSFAWSAMERLTRMNRPEITDKMKRLIPDPRNTESAALYFSTIMAPDTVAGFEAMQGQFPVMSTTRDRIDTALEAQTGKKHSITPLAPRNEAEKDDFERYISEGGRYYVVRRDWGTYFFVHHLAGHLMNGDATRYEGKSGLGVESGDRILKQFDLRGFVRWLAVSPDGRGFVAVETERIGSESSIVFHRYQLWLVLYDAQHDILRRTPLEDSFTPGVDELDLDGSWFSVNPLLECQFDSVAGKIRLLSNPEFIASPGAIEFDWDGVHRPLSQEEQQRIFPMKPT